ncbi:hypothetical protein BU17DRAFT_68057 [Hysterangium stoloniferum]|nr:hypothetical protein BU17DRAFT_68057 [Hysterangium stoloniferum]
MCKKARIITKSRQEGFNEDINNIINMLEKDCKEIGARWKKSTQTVMHAICAPGKMAKQKQSINLVNAARAVPVWLRGEKLDLTEDEKIKFEEIQASLNNLSRPEQAKQLPDEMKTFLRSKAEEL